MLAQLANISSETINTKCFILQIGFNVKARTRFVCKLSMPVYCRGWVFSSQQFHQITQRGFLLRCACVLWFFIIGSHSTDIANADTVSVLPGAVCAHYLNVAPGVYAAVAVDNKVVAYPVPSQFSVPGIYLLGGRALPGSYARAMQDNQ